MLDVSVTQIVRKSLALVDGLVLVQYIAGTTAKKSSLSSTLHQPSWFDHKVSSDPRPGCPGIQPCTGDLDAST